MDYDPSGFVDDEWRPTFESNSFTHNEGLSTVRYTNLALWACERGRYALRTGSPSGSWVGCPLACPPGTHFVRAAARHLSRDRPR